MSFILGIEDSNFDIPLSNKIYTKGQSDVSIDYRNDPFFADIQYGSDLLSSETWSMQEIDLEEYTAATDYKHAGITFNYQHSAHLSSQAGIQITRFNNASTSQFQDDLLMDEWAAYENGVAQGNIDDKGTVSIDNFLPTQLTKPLYQHPNANWLTLKANTALQYFGIDPFNLANNDADIRRLQSQISEDKKSSFFLLSWEKSPFSIKAGLRFQQEKVQVLHHVLTDKLIFNQKHNNWLPSINMSWEFKKDWLLRASLSKNTTRPALSDLSSTLDYEEETNTIMGFNGSLAPYNSSNLDLALEGYISNNILFSLSAFYKSITDFIATNTNTKTFGETGLPNLWPTSNLNDNTTVNVISKNNQESASLGGIETMLRYEWSNLPTPW